MVFTILYQGGIIKNQLCYRTKPNTVAGLGAEAQNRTGDTRIFSPLLYRLSYLGIEAKSLKVGDNLATKFLFTPAGSTSSNSAMASSCIPSIIWL